METYNVIEISTGNIMLENSTQEECLQWIETYGDIINYTIVPYQ
jgi:phosphosulfolactate synthase (CoM biosynthesis protein A)